MTGQPTAKQDAPATKMTGDVVKTNIHLPYHKRGIAVKQNFMGSQKSPAAVLRYITLIFS